MVNNREGTPLTFFQVLFHNFPIHRYFVCIEVGVPEMCLQLVGWLPVVFRAACCQHFCLAQTADVFVSYQDLANEAILICFF